MFGFKFTQPKNERPMPGASRGGVKNAIFGVLGGAALLFASGANAAMLNLTLQDAPDIFSSFIDVTYNAGTEVFDASGFAVSLDDDGVGAAEPILGGTFDITASIDNSGNASGGSLLIGGTIPTLGLGFLSGTLLTGTLTNFGFPSGGGDPLEFLFNVTGGDAAGLFTAVDPLAGVILTNSGFDVGESFAADFANNGIEGLADTAPVPLPAAVWLIGSGLIALFGIARRKGGSQA